MTNGRHRRDDDDWPADYYWIWFLAVVVVGVILWGTYPW